jgi:hypothetical protein
MEAFNQTEGREISAPQTGQSFLYACDVSYIKKMLGCLDDPIAGLHALGQ